MQRLDHRLEHLEVGGVVDALLEGDVDGVVAAALGAQLIHVTRAGKEVVAVLVERHRHHPVRQVERLLDAVAMVDVDVNVEHSRVVLEEL